MLVHSSILDWEIPWTEGLGGLQSMRLQRVGHSFCFYGAKKSKCNGKYFVVIEFNNKRSLEVYRYFPLFVYTNVYKGLRKKEPLTSGGWPGVTTGCCSCPVGCKGSHRTPASHRVTLRAGAKETANTHHCAPQHHAPLPG